MRFFGMLTYIGLFTLLVIGDIVLFFIYAVITLTKNLAKGFLFLARAIGTFIMQFFRFMKRVIVAIIKFLKKKVFKKKPKQTQFFSPIRMKLKYFFLGVFFASVFFLTPMLIFFIHQSLPNPNQLGLQQFPQTTKIYDRNHKLLYQIYATQNRTLVHLSDIPLSLQQATIAIEDKNFYKNPGVDMSAIIRAVITNIQGRNFQGGSTITQQLIKSALLTPKISIWRKVEEVILAFWTERLYSKKQILEMYFNQVPYGGTAWGVETASQTYFGENVKDLDLAQSAFLAGMPQAPSIYSPFGPTPTLWKKRQKEVLDRMKDLSYITGKQEQDALEETLTFIPLPQPLIAPHFVMYVRDLLIQKYGIGMVEKGGLSVTTSLDSTLQQIAQETVTNEVSKDTYLLLSNGAALITNPQNGDILAMVGSVNYNNDNWGNVNLTTSLRQPGSSIKLVTYAAALSKGFTAATILDDSPVSYPDGINMYSPVNYDGKFHGKLPLRLAFANSINIPAVKTLNTVGIPAFVTLGKEMGISNLEDASHYGLSVTLGSADVTMLDMATAYGTVANSGLRVDLNPLLKVTDYQGNVLEEKKDIFRLHVLDAGVAFILSNILADNAARSMEFGPNSPLFIPDHMVSVKTGTSDNKRDNWTIGYTPNYVVAVWVGNNDNSPMSQVLASGITGAAPIWHTIMSTILQNKPNTTAAIPSNIIVQPCYGKPEYFIAGTEKSVNCTYTAPTPSASPTP
ncbi:MAG: transglycosylase domain-containing protein [Candidatus Levyibacteriota bacterium]